MGVFKSLKWERIDPLSRIIITAKMICLSNLDTVRCFSYSGLTYYRHFLYIKMQFYAKF